MLDCNLMNIEPPCIGNESTFKKLTIYLLRGTNSVSIKFVVSLLTLVHFSLYSLESWVSNDYDSLMCKSIYPFLCVYGTFLLG